MSPNPSPRALGEECRSWRGRRISYHTWEVVMRNRVIFPSSIITFLFLFGAGHTVAQNSIPVTWFNNLDGVGEPLSLLQEGVSPDASAKPKPAPFAATLLVTDKPATPTYQGAVRGAPNLPDAFETLVATQGELSLICVVLIADATVVERLAPPTPAPLIVIGAPATC